MRWLGLAFLLLVVGCKQDAAPAVTEKGKPTVFTVNYPLAYFAERIGGDAIDVQFPCPAEEDPDFWKPTPEIIEQYQKADLILLNGASYAHWTVNASLPLGKCVDTSAAFATKLIQIENAVTHSHGPSGEHSHSGTASLTWLDPQQAIQQAEAVRDSLIRLRPENTDGFKQRFLELQQDFQKLDRELETITKEAKPRPLIGSHPVFQYLARRYNLNMKNVHFEAEEMPSEEQFKELQAILAKHPAKFILWESTPKPEIAAKVKAQGLESIDFLTTGNRPDEGDLFSVMRDNAANLRKVYQQ
jgi:zinc transport system substrate-binding protein